jgi:hypothetical protein
VVVGLVGSTAITLMPQIITACVHIMQCHLHYYLEDDWQKKKLVISLKTSAVKKEPPEAFFVKCMSGVGQYRR